MTVPITCNGSPHELEEAVTIAELLQQLNFNPRQVAVEVNLDLVPRERHAEVRLQAGDCVEVVTLAGGG